MTMRKKEESQRGDETATATPVVLGTPLACGEEATQEDGARTPAPDAMSTKNEQSQRGGGTTTATPVVWGTALVCGEEATQEDGARTPAPDAMSVPGTPRTWLHFTPLVCWVLLLLLSSSIPAPSPININIRVSLGRSAPSRSETEDDGDKVAIPSSPFSLVDISHSVTGRHKYQGGALAKNGLIIFPPYWGADSVGVLDPASGAFQAIDISSEIQLGTRNFVGAATSHDGQVVFAPDTIDSVGVFDPSTLAFRLVSIRDTISSTYMFSGAVAAESGEIVFTPHSAPGVGVFDPRTDKFTLIDIRYKPGVSQKAKFQDRTTGVGQQQKFCGRGAVTKEGKIVFAPFRSRVVGIFDPRTHSFEPVDIGRDFDPWEPSNFCGATTVADGRVIFSPFYGPGLGVFDPATKKFVLVSASQGVSWSQGEWVNDGFSDPTFHAASGKVVFPPVSGKRIGIFHPAEETFEFVDISSAANLGSDNFYSSILADDGKVYFPPSSLDSVGVFDPMRESP